MHVISPNFTYRREEVTPIINITDFLVTLRKHVSWLLGAVGFVFLFFPFYVLVLLPFFSYLLKKIYKGTREDLEKSKNNFDNLSIEEKFKYYYKIEKRVEELNNIKKIKVKAPLNWFFNIVYKHTDQITGLYSDYKTSYTEVLFPEMPFEVTEKEINNFEKFAKDWNGEEWLEYDMEAHKLVAK